MSKDEISFSMEQLKNACERLQEAVANSGDDVLRQDGAIQRFEFTFELLWKTARLYFNLIGKPCNNPRDTLKMAFKEQFFSDEIAVLALLEDRNLSSHVYDFETTRKIFNHIKEKHIAVISALIQEMQKRVETIQ